MPTSDSKAFELLRDMLEDIQQQIRDMDARTTRQIEEGEKRNVAAHDTIITGLNKQNGRVKTLELWRNGLVAAWATLIGVGIAIIKLAVHTKD